MDACDCDWLLHNYRQGEGHDATNYHFPSHPSRPEPNAALNPHRICCSFCDVATVTENGAPTSRN